MSPVGALTLDLAGRLDRPCSTLSTLELAKRLGPRPCTFVMAPEGVKVEALGLGEGNQTMRLTCPAFLAAPIHGQTLCLIPSSADAAAVLSTQRARHYSPTRLVLFLLPLTVARHHQRGGS